MIIIQLQRTVDTYLQGRDAILRGLAGVALSVSDLEDILDVKYHKILFRRRNPASWRPKELVLLGEALRLPTDAIAGIRALVFQLSCLPDRTQSQLLKRAGLNQKKLSIRSRDHDYWQVDELQRLAVALRNWQDSMATGDVPVSAGTPDVMPPHMAFPATFRRREPVFTSLSNPATDRVSRVDSPSA
ncbi:hypothetical protein [Fibrella aquatilis]|uniref:Uncharacterized protein n=1 Tax=Fibrella aquatilis TaxID=2817059 RepID=A0A939K1M5_9BACT|nr:hypothetical protein [Fibrella aquatilis]MBO0933221.1 hypothetical protein [Fibrella aquatilis]